MAITKYASLEHAQVLEIKGSPTRVRHASLGKVADFDQYRTPDGFLYARIRAISSRVNKNHDGWPSIELAGGQDVFDRHTSSADGFSVTADGSRDYGFSTFLGKPIFVDHHNGDPGRARGVIVDAKLHVEDHRTASLDPYYASPDVDPEHLPGTWVELLLEVDAKAFPRFAKAIVEGSRNPHKGIDGWSMGCFVPGTPITLADGTQKPIEAIVVGDVVLTHTGRSEPVTYVMTRPHAGLIYDVATYGQAVPLRLTAEHPIWVKRTPSTYRGKGAVQGGRCLCGRTFDTRASFGAHLREVKRHDLPGEHSRDSTEVLTWIEAKDLRVGDYVLTPMPEGVGHPGSYPFARLLGYYAAEGSFGYDRKRFSDGRPVFVEWTFAADEVEYLNEVQLMLESLGYAAAGPYVKNGSASIRCNSPELAARFLHFGGRYSWGKRLAPEVLRWSPENQKALIDAYFNGDGHQTPGHVEASTVSPDLAHQLQLLALRAGYRMTPPVRQHSPSMTAHRPKMSMQTTIAQPKSMALAHMSEAGMWRRVERIALKHYEGPVYNFDVEGDDSYVAADVAVHNCDVEKSVCSICKNAATAPDDYCQHVRMKGAIFDYTDPHTGRKTSKRAYENCYGVQFFEISGVFDPADETALSLEQARTSKAAEHDAGLRDWWQNVGYDKLPPGACPACNGNGIETGTRFDSACRTCAGTGKDPNFEAIGEPTSEPVPMPEQSLSSVRTAENAPPQSEMAHAPEPVDTLREEEVCPVCGSSMDEDTCAVCGYQQPPEGFDNPDLTKAQQAKDAPTPGKPAAPEPGPPAPEQPNLAPPDQGAVATPTNPTALAHVSSDMTWDVPTKTSARINKTEQPLVSTIKPQTNEPQEKILTDQLRPVTSQVRTAEDFIAAAGAHRRNTMNHTADAASGVPAVAKPDVKTDVTGVGGVDQASNEAASKADAQIDVVGVGGTGVESVSADKEGVNVAQGDEHSKNIEAIHTDTWSGTENQHDPVTSEVPSWIEESRWSHWHVESHEDGPLEHQEQQGGDTWATKERGAVQGVKPIAEQFGDRVDVLKPLTSPANNSGPTTTWTGTGGNGVTKQQDPVTTESIARGESEMEGSPNWTSSAHIFTAFKLADLEVALGLTPAEKKYIRAAELERETPEVIAAELKYAQRVKAASIRKAAGVQKLPMMGRPTTVTKEATAAPAEDDSFMFGGL